MYVNQKCCVKWGSASSDYFTVRNGVKQGGVISPLLFSMYLDHLLLELKSSGYGCYIGNTFTGALAYADDIVLLSPSLYGMQKMLNICETYSKQYDVTFNAMKSKVLIFDNKREDIYDIRLKLYNAELPISKCEKHLGCFVGSDCVEKRIENAVTEIFCNSNLLLSNFGMSHLDTKYSLFKAYCSLYKVLCYSTMIVLI